MKNLTKYIATALLLSLMISCGKDNDNLDGRPLSLADLVGKVIVTEHNDGTLITWFFHKDHDNVIKTYYFLKNREGIGGSPVLKNSHTITLYDGELILLVSKGIDGKLTLDKFVYESFPVRNAVLYDGSASQSFFGAKYQENEASFIGFADDKWGWSGTAAGIAYTSVYFLLDKGGFVGWRSENNAGVKYMGVNIPSGVQWNGQSGPLMLIDRDGFTRPSVYKPI